MRLWEVNGGHELRVLQGHTNWVRSVAFNPDGRILASGSDDGSVRLWEVNGGHELRVLQGHTNWVRSVAFNPDGRILASGSDDGNVRLWEVNSGRELQVLQGHTDKVHCVTFRPDGRMLASCSDDGTIRLWNSEDGQLISAIEGRIQPQMMCLFKDDTLLAIGDAKGVIEIWDLASLQKQTTYTFQSGTITRLDFLPSTQELVSASDDGSICVIDVVTGKRRLIRQELHCFHTNIFKTIGLREDQRTLLLHKGAIEIDPSVLNTKRKRLQQLAQRIKSKRQEGPAPAILIIGPGTFLPSSEEITGPSTTQWEYLTQDILATLKKANFNFDAMQPYVNAVYQEFDRFSTLRQMNKSAEKAISNNILLQEQYTALIQLINERCFQVIFDMDIFSRVQEGMFSSSLLKLRYEEVNNDAEYALSRLRRSVRFVEHGETLFMKYFSPEEHDERKSYRGKSLYLEDILNELFEMLRFQTGENATLIWTGFYADSMTRFLNEHIRIMLPGSEQAFFWVMDDAIRKRSYQPIAATDLNYPVGQFSNVFSDLYEVLDITKTHVPNTEQTSLYELADSWKVENRVLAARELVNAVATGSRSLPDVQRLLLSLAQDKDTQVQLALLQAILKQSKELPAALTDWIAKFAQNSDDRLRATVAKWVITEYGDESHAYEHILMNLVNDKSEYVRDTILNTVKRHFELLPAHIHDLGSRLVGETKIEIELIKGGGMLEGKESELIVQAKNCTDRIFSQVTIKLQESAEYFILSPNPCTLSDVQARQKQTVSFHLKMRTHGRIAVNYYINGEMRNTPLYIQVIQDNPYIYGPPVHKIGFFGRQEELDDILQAILKPLKEDILLVGERRIGKTSALNQIKMQLGRPFLPVYIVLNTVEPETEKILKLILTKIIETLIDDKLLDTSWTDHHFHSEYFERNIAEIIQAAREHVTDIKLVLLLDEADYLLKVLRNQSAYLIDPLQDTQQIDDRVQNILRAMLQSEVGMDVRVVVAGTNDLSGYIAQRSSPFYNHFREVTLKPLTSEETRELVLKPVSVLGYTYTPKIVDRIIALSGGLPYLCQGLCYEAFSYARRSQNSIIDETALAAAEKKITRELFSKYYLPSFWKRMNTNEHVLLANLIKGKSSQGITLQQAKRLLDWQLLIKKQRTYNFQAELFRIWTHEALESERL